MKFNLFDYTITIKKKRKKYIKKALDAPVAPNGYVHRWIRAESISFNNRKNIIDKVVHNRLDIILKYPIF